MVAQLLRLKVDALVNGWTRQRAGAFRAAGVLVALILAILIAGRMISLGATDAPQLRAVSVAVGVVILVCAVLLPAAIARIEPLSPRALVGYGIRPVPASGALVLTDLVAPHVAVLAVLLVGYVAGWTAAGQGFIALVAAVLLFAGCVLLVRLSATLGAVVARSPMGRNLQALLWTALVVALAIVVVPTVADPRYFATNVATMAERLDRLLVGTVWDAPALHNESGTGGLVLLVAFGADLLLAGLWVLVVVQEFRPPRPERETDGLDRLGVFRLTGGSPLAAIAARTVVYWLRDPRYASVLVPLPIIPILMLAAAGIGGIPLSVMALVPLPVVVLLLGWGTMHNDVAYDSTAVWQHVVAPLSGAADRVGRAIPVLVLGGLVIAVGTPLTAWGAGTAAVVPAVIGMSVATLLGSIGVSSLVSARFPYAAPSPGSSGFRAPQTDGGSGGAVQVLSVLVIALVAAPAVAATVMALSGGVAWSWIALAAGLATGIPVALVGVIAGGRVFEHRGPEIVAFAVRN